MTTRASVAAVTARLLDWRTWRRLARVVNFLVYDGAPLALATVGAGARIAPTVSVRHGERVRIGSGAQVGQGCYLWAGGSTGSIELGDHALLAPEVFITAANYAIDTGGGPVMDLPMREEPVRIGANTWLGARVVVLPGVTIGDGTVVAAGSVVTRDLPGGVVAAGVPARVLRERGAG